MKKADVVYCDFDKDVCAWTQNLVAAGEIPHGEVWCRSIRDIKPSEVRGLRQFHVFNGISGWPLALKLAAWPESVSVISGSAPCQSFSSAGKQKGFNDPRHLWPDMFRLIRESNFDVAIGEQVGAAIGFGWLDGVLSDLEKEKYACGAVVLPACGVGAPHIRQRVYWVAERLEHRASDRWVKWRTESGRRGTERGCSADGVADASGLQPQGSKSQCQENGLCELLGDESGIQCVADSTVSEFRHRPSTRKQSADKQDSGVGPLAFPYERGWRGRRDGDTTGGSGAVQVEGRSRSCPMADGECRGCGGKSPESGGDEPDRSTARWEQGADRAQHGCGLGDTSGDVLGRLSQGAPGTEAKGDCGGGEDGSGGVLPGPASYFDRNPWSDFSTLPCTDGRWRRTGTGVPVLAAKLPRSMAALGPELHGLAELAGLSRSDLKAAKSHRLHVLKGMGNAIVPHLAAEFVRVFLDAKADTLAAEELI